MSNPFDFGWGSGWESIFGAPKPGSPEMDAAAREILSHATTPPKSSQGGRVDMGGVQSRRDLILITTEDLARDLIDARSDDEELPRGSVEAALAAGEITQAEIVSAFADELRGYLA